MLQLVTLQRQPQRRVKETQVNTVDQVDACAFDRDMAERWHLYKPPARPSPGDTAVYESFMREPMRTLLLGSTPEIRSLARRYGHHLTAVDLDPQVYRALERLVDSPGGEAERFVCCDWLEMELQLKFDLVIGDGSINMLPPCRHAKFLERLAAHSKRGSLLLLRSYLLEEPRFETPDEVFARFRDTEDDLYTATKIHLSQLWADRETGEMSNAVFWANLQELHNRGVTTEDEHRELGRILAEDTLSVYFVKRAEFEEQVAPYYVVEDILTAGDYESHEMKPILCMRRK